MKGKSRNSGESRTSMASAKADLRELKANSRATVQELQLFLRELKGKSPPEMLGIVASSQLIRAIVLSVILVIVAIFALTAIPYFFGNKESPDPEQPIVTNPGTFAAEPKQADPNPKQIKPAEPLAPLGLNEKKNAPANVNPLEDDGGSFLKDLE